MVHDPKEDYVGEMCAGITEELYGMNLSPLIFDLSNSFHMMLLLQYHLRAPWTLHSHRSYRHMFFNMKSNKQLQCMRA